MLDSENIRLRTSANYTTAKCAAAAVVVVLAANLAVVVGIAPLLLCVGAPIERVTENGDPAGRGRLNDQDIGGSGN
ncbi:hypothetical protein MY11210_002253 [Beauveria gryllotalpidicola]